jgi:hypothetical protein
MNLENIKKLFIFLSIYFLLFLLACGTTSGGIIIDQNKSTESKHSTTIKKGPPPHAPAHGYRAKFRYWYYPSCSIYFDVDRKIYFFVKDNNWQATVSLPDYLHLKLDSYVVLEIDTDKPFEYYKEHKKKYTPGKTKKQKKK